MLCIIIVWYFWGYNIYKKSCFSVSAYTNQYSWKFNVFLYFLKHCESCTAGEKWWEDKAGIVHLKLFFKYSSIKNMLWHWPGNHVGYVYAPGSPIIPVAQFYLTSLVDHWLWPQLSLCSLLLQITQIFSYILLPLSYPSVSGFNSLRCSLETDNELYGWSYLSLLFSNLNHHVLSPAQ